MIDFNEHKNQCPANVVAGMRHPEELCTWQISYNGHVNDRRYGRCDECNCPVFFWVQKAIEV